MREAENVFLVEGDKMVAEAVGSGQPVELLCATASFLAANGAGRAREVIEASRDELGRASLLQSPQNALAVVKIIDNPFRVSMVADCLTLALDCIQDPGNLGTIIRIADWFGIGHLLCSEDTVDCYNPKVIQSSMGSIFRVKVHYCNLEHTLKEARDWGIPVFGTFLDGENIYRHPLSRSGILVLGNEGNGISPGVEKHAGERIFIPSFGGGAGRPEPFNSGAGRPESLNSGLSGPESLNVATAAAICCAEFRRRINYQ